MALNGLLDDVSAAYAWYRGLGNTCHDTGLGLFVVNKAHPNVWSANHVSRVTAAASDDIDTLLAEIERRFAHCSHREVVTDCFTAPQVEARLTLESYVEQTPVVQMVLHGALASVRAPDVVLRAVETEADWDRLRRLVERDFEEGARSGGKTMPPDVVSGIVAGYRAKGSAVRFFLGIVDDEPAAYGSSVRCPNGLGLLEDFFTLPAYRGRGIASAILKHAVGELRKNGHDVVFIGAHVTERAKDLYARLGFAPAMVSRAWVRR